MEFLDTRNASEDEKREIEKILSNRSSSIEFPFEINHFTSKSLNCSGEKECKVEKRCDELEDDKNVIECNQMCSIPPITHYGDHFIPNHIPSNISSYPATFYGHKARPTLSAESELYYFGSSFAPVANSSKVDAIGEENSVKVPIIPISAHYAPVSLSSISQVGVTPSDVTNRGPITPISCSSDPNLCTGVDDSNGSRAGVTASSRGPFQVTFNPHSNPAYLPSTAFIPTPGANFPTPPHMYPYMFQVPFPPFYSVTTHLPSNLSLPSSVQRDHSCSYNNITSSNNCVPEIKSYDKKQIIHDRHDEIDQQESIIQEREEEEEEEEAEAEEEIEEDNVNQEGEEESSREEENNYDESDTSQSQTCVNEKETQIKGTESSKDVNDQEKGLEESEKENKKIKGENKVIEIADKNQENNTNNDNVSKTNKQSCSEEDKEGNKEKDDSLSSKLNNITNNSNQSNAVNNLSSLRSWADLFKEGNTTLCPYNSSTSASSTFSANASFSHRSSSNETKSDDDNNQISARCNETLPSYILLQEDMFAVKIGKRLKEIHLKHSLPYLLPRGFVNRGNWCYINATLQALLYCPPFYNLMREIGEISGIFREKSSTPIIDSFAKFFSNFLPCEPMMKKSKHSNSNANFSEGAICDVPKGEPFEPKCIYDVLCYIKSECLKGKQEDAEEFLSSVLNGLHDEMVSIFKFLDKRTNGESESSINTNGHLNYDEINDQKSNSDDNDASLWNVVGPRHKALPTRSAKVSESTIVDIFGGSVISVRTAGTDKCGNKQPFFTLQLDIQSDKIKSIEDALRSLTSRESIQGYTCPKTKQMVDASYQTFLEQLPPILILHLKLFVYDKDGGSKKLVKKIDYPIDLDLPRDCLHIDRGDKNKYSKSYKLLSVVYHDGNESVKGHYLTDIFHIGSSNWLRCDDNNVKTITTQQLLNPQAPRVPYLLFYRRCDTLRGSNSNQPQRGLQNSSQH